MPEPTQKSVSSAGVLLCLLFFSLPSSLLGSEYRFFENGEPLALGSDLGYLLDTPTRRKIDLSGTWSYAVEGGQSGEVRVPSAYDFRGRVTFERVITLDAEELDPFQWNVVLLGVEHQCEVFVNGEFVGAHSGGYTSFSFSIPPSVLQPGGGNTIRVVVSNELDPRSTLPLRQLPGGWRSYGGITRDIFLLGTPKAFFRDVSVRADVSTNLQAARLFVSAVLEGDWPDTAALSAMRDGPAVLIEVLDRLSEQPVARAGPIAAVVRGGRWDTVSASVAITSPRLWSPSTPDLYMVRCRLVSVSGRLVDQYDVNTGIRALSIDNGDFVLNGKRLVVRGVTWYEEHPLWGSAVTLEQREKDIVLMRALGANAVRFMFHSPHPYMLNLCDRYGLLALVELPVFRAPAGVTAQPAFREIASGVLRQMIVRDRSHPSVLAWGLGNECETVGDGPPAFFGHLDSVARELDDRPLYMTLRAGVPDSLTRLTDITALNVGAADGPALARWIEEWRRTTSRRPVLLTMLGTEVQEDNLNGYNDPLSQQAQARFFLQRLETSRMGDADGVFGWSFHDWTASRPSLVVHSGDPWLESRGLLNARREKRLAYDAVRSVYRSEKFVALPAGTAPSQGPITFVLAGFIALIGGVYIYNANRRFRECLLRSVMSSFNFFADIRDQRLVSLVHSTLLGLLVSVATAIVLASIFLFFRESEFLDAALSIVLVSDGLKEAVVRLIWDPVMCILALSGLLWACLMLVSLLLPGLRIVLRGRVSLYHTYAVTTWSTPPLLVLIPMGMILYRVLESSFYIIPTLVVVGILHLWVVLRFLRGVAIIFDARPVKVYVLALVVFGAAAGLLWAYYDAGQAASMHLRYLYTLLVQAG